MEWESVSVVCLAQFIFARSLEDCVCFFFFPRKWLTYFVRKRLANF